MWDLGWDLLAFRCGLLAFVWDNLAFGGSLLALGVGLLALDGDLLALACFRGYFYDGATPSESSGKQKDTSILCRSVFLLIMFC